MKTHIEWMELALNEAKLAAREDEIPVGAVLVRGNELILSDHNRTRQLQNPLAHAEKLIIDKITSSKIKYLQDYTLYVSLEPCLMCAGMMIWSRLGTLVMGAEEPKSGCAGSVYNVLRNKSFNHEVKIVRGILKAESAALLQDFFKTKR
ncbi:MAG: nucleoside deaminase [Candidatus Cloacimonadota bacterium]